MYYKTIFATLAITLIELFNVMLHISTYALTITIGEAYFLVDIFGLPEYEAIQNLTVADLLSTLLGFGAVATPIGVWHWFLEHQEEIFEDQARFFANGMNRVIAVMLATIYGFVVLSEFSVLMLRSLEAVNTGPIGSVGDEQAGFLPLVIISTTVILLNFGLGFAVANLIRKFQQVEEL